MVRYGLLTGVPRRRIIIDVEAGPPAGRSANGFVIVGVTRSAVFPYHPT